MSADETPVGNPPGSAGGDPPGSAGGHPPASAHEPPERTSRQVWTLGAKILGIQVVTMLLLWWLQAAYAGGG